MECHCQPPQLEGICTVDVGPMDVSKHNIQANKENAHSSLFQCPKTKMVRWKFPETVIKPMYPLKV